MSEEMPSNPQHNHLGMESNEWIEADVVTMPGAGGMLVGDGLDKTLTRAVSFFGPGWTETRAKAWAAVGASERGS